MQIIRQHNQGFADVNADAQAAKFSLEALIVQIDALLPQTQCRQCGYEGCKPYAAAIAAGEADINQCPPGGEPGLQALANLLQRPYQALNLAHGITKAKAVAVIDEATCIGCTLCINACPVDAILGASKYMHTVISQECTGCELCLPPCPVDCIRTQPVGGRALAMNTAEANLARNRHQQRLTRQALEKRHKAHTYNQRTPALATITTEPSIAEQVAAGQTTADSIKKAAIAAAMARVKAQKAG